MAFMDPMEVYNIVPFKIGHMTLKQWNELDILQET